MIELAIVGSKKSGKTTVIEKLIRFLVDKGYRVATIKHTSHRHQFDTPGKDSHRHRQAGAELTIARSGEEIGIFAQPDSLDIGQIQDASSHLIDIWLIEGDRRANRPKILITRQPEELLKDMPGNIVATIGPEPIDGIPAHFETGDYQGLGSFVIDTMLGEKRGIRCEN